MRKGGGHDEPGKLSGDGSAWTSDRTVTPSTTYEITIATRASDGQNSTVTDSFTTRRPEKADKLTNAPGNGGTVGTGMPVSLLFDNPVDTAHHAAVEKALTVTTEPRVEGSWGRVKDHSGKDRIDWRPKDPRPAGTKVSVKGALDGLDTKPGNGFEDWQETWQQGQHRSAESAS
ncbi:Ig-like domain-containing protein [Streptomyces violascens]|uniref:Ig-like domain-containing protein n=1 Tax=Streptomyces violascens TaxID=67381 RepID=UPI00369D5EA3